MANDYYGYTEEDSPKKGRDNLFLWTVFILLLIGMAFACWLGSFYVFGHPEQPRCYRLLKKLNKIEPPRRFEVTAAPAGEFLSAQKLFDKYAKFSRLELERENAELLRNYISNYKETKKLIPYIKGRFNILDSYELGSGDLFGSGVVALAQAADCPQVLIEHVYTAQPTTIPMLRKMLQTGLDMSIERTLDLSALIHVERVYDGRLMFTVMPLLYGTYALKQGSGTFGLEPPPDINPEAGAPVTKLKQLEDGLKKFAAYRQRNPISPQGADGVPSPAPQNPELVRLDIPDEAKVAVGPAMPVATPMPMGPKPKSTPQFAMVATPRPFATPLPVATPPPLPPLATPLPKVSPQGVPLTPFLAANPAPGLPNANSGNWRTFGAGKLPPGRSITPKDAGSLVERGDLGERIYLRGQFIVTASGEGKAVLRPQEAIDPNHPAVPTRIIVEYPAGSVPPQEGNTFARDEARGFEIRDVRKGADGQINIFVREIAVP